MKYLKAFLIWIVIIPIAILNGGLREYVFSGLGNVAMPLSGIILSICIFIIAYIAIPKIKNCTKTDAVVFGIMWFLLTNLFDYLLLLTSGNAFAQLLHQYDFTSGNLWIVVVLSSLLAPWFAFKFKKKSLK